jgi:hypothetical protein
MDGKFWIAFVVAFILLYAFAFLLHGVVLMKSYEPFAGKAYLEPDRMASRQIWIPVGLLILAFIWTYFFHRFATEKNVLMGIQHGVSYMIFLYLPSAFINYATLNASGYHYLGWLIGGIVQGVVIGAIMGLIMKQKPEAAPVPAPEAGPTE